MIKKNFVVIPWVIFFSAWLVFFCYGRKKRMAMTLVSQPVGRFVINLPEESSISWGRQGFDYGGPFIESFTAESPEFLKEILDEDIKPLQVPHDDGGLQLDNIVQGNIPNSWFVYYWNITLIKTNIIKLKGFFWKQGIGFVFKNSARNDKQGIQERENLLNDLFQRINLRSEREIPTEPGFCFKHAYFRGEPVADPNEHIAIHASLPSKPGVFIRFTTDVVGQGVVSGPNLLERKLKNPLPFGLSLIVGIRRLRLEERWVGPYRGHELIERIREANGTVGYSFMWEYSGEVDSATSPAMMLELMTGYAEPPINSTLSRKEAMALWDAMLNSIRYRVPSEPLQPGA